MAIESFHCCDIYWGFVIDTFIVIIAVNPCSVSSGSCIGCFRCFSYKYQKNSIKLLIPFISNLKYNLMLLINCLKLSRNRLKENAS